MTSEQADNPKKYDMKKAQEKVGKHKTFFYKCIDAGLPISEQFIKNRRYFSQRDIEIFKFADQEWIWKAFNKYLNVKSNPVVQSSSKQFATVENKANPPANNSKKSSKDSNKTSKSRIVQNSNTTVSNSSKLEDMQKQIDLIKKKFNQELKQKEQEVKQKENEKKEIKKDYQQKIERINDAKLRKEKKYERNIKQITEQRDYFLSENIHLKEETKKAHRINTILAVLISSLTTGVIIFILTSW